MPFKIQYCSDLHLEFSENREYLKKHPIQPVGDILLLAGDIIPFVEMDKHGDFFNEVADKFETVYWIPGNHEYYYFDAVKKSGNINEKIRSNLFLINNDTVFHNNIRFIFSTLWSKISHGNEWWVERGMSDFKVIKYNDSFFSSADFNDLHKESLIFINQEAEKKHVGKTVLMTHHVPTLLNYPKQFKGSVLNEAFAVELFDFIEQSNFDYWIYGHSHTNTPDFFIGDTKMLTNQLGYVSSNEQRQFDRGKIISID